MPKVNKGLFQNFAKTLNLGFFITYFGRNKWKRILDSPTKYNIVYKISVTFLGDSPFTQVTFTQVTIKLYPSHKTYL